jgi:peptidyl-prolyl cis-trans isomerase SurA
MKIISIVFLASNMLFASSAQSAVVDRIRAIVNSEIVTQSDIEAFKQRLNHNQPIDELLLIGQTTDELKKNERFQLDYLIHERLMRSEIKRLNLSVTIERVEQEIRDLARRNNMSRSDLLAAVKAQGMGVAEYQQFIRDRIERQSLVESEIISKVRVTDEDIIGAYQRQFPESKTGQFEYTLSHILFTPKKGGEQAARERATSVAARLISNPQSFEALAEQHSEDPNFSQGGSLGVFKTSDLPPQWDVALLDLEPGQVSRIVPSRAGFHILKVNQKRLIPDPAFEKQKEKIRSQLFEAGFQKHFKDWIASKRDDAFIKINE